ncbi:hypothetical protein JCM3774_001362 [Rhodotorula dairenensis]
MPGADWLAGFDPRKRLEALAGRDHTSAHYARPALPLSTRPRFERPPGWETGAAPVPSTSQVRYPSAAKPLPLKSERPPPPAPPPRPAPWQPRRDEIPPPKQQQAESTEDPVAHGSSKVIGGPSLGPATLVGRPLHDGTSKAGTSSETASHVREERDRTNDSAGGTSTSGPSKSYARIDRELAPGSSKNCRGDADRGKVVVVEEEQDARTTAHARARRDVAKDDTAAKLVSQRDESGRSVASGIRREGPTVQGRGRLNSNGYVAQASSPSSVSVKQQRQPRQPPDRSKEAPKTPATGGSDIPLAPLVGSGPAADLRLVKAPKRARIQRTWSPVQEQLHLAGVGEVGRVVLTKHEVFLRLGSVAGQEWLADVSRAEQVQALLSTLCAHERHDSPNVTLREDPTATDAAAYTVLAPSLNRALLACDDPHHCLPPTTSLNHLLADGTTSLSYFTYHTWIGVRGEAASREFDRFANLPEWRKLARVHDHELYFDRWIANLPSTTDGWNRKAAYVGYSDGFDHLHDEKEPYWRVPGHFVGCASAAKSLHQLIIYMMGEFKRRQSEHAKDSFVFLTILSTAESLDTAISHADVMDVEALHSAAAQSHTGDGGANCAPCGSLGTNGLIEAIAHLDDALPVSSDIISYTLRDMLEQRYLGAETLRDVRAEANLRQAEADARAEERRKNGDTAEPKRKSIRNPRFSKTPPRLRKKRARVVVPVTSKPRKPAASRNAPSVAIGGRVNVKFTAADDERIVRLHNDGYSLREIGETFTPRKDPKTIHARLDTLLNKGGPTYHVYTPEEDKEIIRFFKTDRRQYPFSEIMERLDLTENQEERHRTAVAKDELELVGRAYQAKADEAADVRSELLWTARKLAGFDAARAALSRAVASQAQEHKADISVRLREHDAALKDALERVDVLEADIVEQKRLAKQRELDLASSQAEYESALAQEHRSREAAESASARIETLEAALQKCEADLLAAHSSTSDELEAARKHAADCESELGRARLEIARLKTSCGQYESELDKSTRELDALTADRNRLAAECERLAIEKEHETEALDLAMEKRRLLELDLTRLRKEVHAKQQELEHADRLRVELVFWPLSLRSRLTDAPSFRHHLAIQADQKAITELTSAASEQQARFEELQQALESLRGRAEEAEQQRADAEALRGEVTEWREKYDSAEQARAEQEGALAARNCRATELETRCQRLELSLLDSEAEASRASAQVHKLGAEQAVRKEERAIEAARVRQILEDLGVPPAAVTSHELRPLLEKLQQRVQEQLVQLRQVALTMASCSDLLKSAVSFARDIVALLPSDDASTQDASTLNDLLLEILTGVHELHAAKAQALVESEAASEAIDTYRQTLLGLSRTLQDVVTTDESLSVRSPADTAQDLATLARKTTELVNRVVDAFGALKERYRGLEQAMEKSEEEWEVRQVELGERQRHIDSLKDELEAAQVARAMLEERFRLIRVVVDGTPVPASAESASGSDGSAARGSGAAGTAQRTAGVA